MGKLSQTRAPIYEALERGSFLLTFRDISTEGGIRSLWSFWARGASVSM